MSNDGPVFISYMENPDVDADENEPTRREKRAEQRRLIREFAEFLVDKGIEIEYDQTLERTGQDPENWILWTSEMIERARFVLMICTSNYIKYLTSSQPSEINSYGTYRPLYEEGKIVFSMMMQKLKKFVPIFLNRPRRLEHVPIALQGSSVYEIRLPAQLDLHRHGPLEVLYARLSAQNPYKAPPTGNIVRLQAPKLGSVRILGGGRCFGSQGSPIQVSGSLTSSGPTPPPAATSAASSVVSPATSPWEKYAKRKVDENMITHGIGDHLGAWMSIARKLGFSEGQMQNLKHDYNLEGQAEQGIQMLLKWLKDNGDDATVKVLITGLEKANRMDVVERLEEYINKN